MPWIRRTARAARQLFVSMGFEPSAVRVLRSIHELASKRKTRVPTPCAVGFLAGTSPWKDTRWWKQMQAMGRLLDPSGQEGWKHSAGGPRGKL